MARSLAFEITTQSFCFIDNPEKGSDLFIERCNNDHLIPLFYQSTLGAPNAPNQIPKRNAHTIIPTNNGGVNNKNHG